MSALQASTKKGTGADAYAVWLERLLQDSAYGLRMLTRNPGFSLAVILTLALGIGMNTAMFSVMNAVLLHPIAYPDAGRLLWVANYDTDYQSENDHRMLPSDYAEFKQRASPFESMAAYCNEDLAVVYAGDSTTERIASVTGDFWSITAAQPALGRLFRAGESREIVLSWEMFERRFGSDPHVVGKTVAIEGHPFEIVGVLPAHFRFLFPQFLYADDERKEIDAYIAVPNAGLNLPITSYRGGNWDKVRAELGPTPDFVWVVVKLRPGLPLKRAQVELGTIYERLVRQSPGVYHTHSALRVVPLQAKLAGSVRPAILVLAGAVGFVLLIVCGNVANLLLARASSRQREIAIRTALGAKRSRLMQQLLTESLLLSTGGAIAGSALATGVIAIVVRLGTGAVPRLGETRMDGQVLLFTLAASLLAAFLFGFGPAASLLRSEVHSSLKEETSTSSAGAGRLRVRAFLTAIEISLAVVLLSGAGLMLKSYWRMSAFPPGFSPEKIVALKISLSGSQYKSWPRQHTYIDEFFHRVQSVPGVEAAGIHCTTFNTSIRVAGVSSKNQIFAAIEYVSPGYLRAMGVPLLDGNWPTENEVLDRVIVNESFARRIGGAGDLIGKHIHASLLSATIAGIVPDFKTSQLDAEPGPAVYAAYELSPRISFLTAAIRVAGHPAAVLPGIRKLVSSIDPNVSAYQFETLERQLADSITPRRFNLFLLSSFAAAAVLLALIGVYGVISHLVAQRTHEIGIRVALGAQRREVVGMVIGQGLAIILAGIIVGVVAALGLARLMISLLYGVKPNDPSTLLAVVAGLTVVALLACWAPALKAARVDPLIALRHE